MRRDLSRTCFRYVPTISATTLDLLAILLHKQCSTTAAIIGLIWQRNGGYNKNAVQIPFILFSNKGCFTRYSSLSGARAQRGPRPPHSMRFLDHTQWRTTVGRTPLDEWSAHRRDLYLTNTQHSQETSIPLEGFLLLSCPLFVLHPFLFLCIDCPAFCLLSLLMAHNTNIHALGGIRTRNPSKRSAADARLRLLGCSCQRESPLPRNNFPNAKI